MYLTWLNHIYDINLNHPLSNIFQADDVMHIEPSSISTCPPPAAQWTTVLPCRSTARDTSQPFWTKWHLVGRLNGKINENCWEFTLPSWKCPCLDRNEQRQHMRDEIGTWQNKTKQLMLQVPGLPRKVTVDVTKCHACHANSRGDNGVQRRPKSATRASPVPKVPPPEPVQCLKCHGCHAK